MVPLLILAAGFSQREASATSLVAIVPTAAVAAVAYISSGVVPWSAIGFGAVIAVGSVALAPLGSAALRTWNVYLVRWVFIGLLIVTAALIFVTVPERASQLDWTVSTVVVLVAIGAVMGFTAGLLGVGGGILAVPALILMGVSDLTAKTLSLVAIVPAAISGSVGSSKAGLVDWRTALPMGIATTAVAPFGVWLSVTIPAEWANPLLAVLILAAASQLAVRAIQQSRRG